MVHIRFLKKKYGSRIGMSWTNVNRLAREIEEASAVAKNLYNKHQAYGAPSLAARTASWNKYMAAHKKTRNLIAKLKTMNQGALQVQLAKIENRRKNLRENLNKVMEGYGFGKRNLIENVFREYAHWSVNDPKKRANKIRNLEAKIEGLPTATNYNRRKKAVAKLALRQAKLSINEKALKKAVELRKKHLAHPESQARATIARGLSRSIVPRTLYGPHGTRTLEAHRRFNAMAGRQTNYLNKYAEAMRQVNRLQRALKRKRNNNNRN
jgi:hypothetical protein